MTAVIIYENMEDPNRKHVTAFGTMYGEQLLQF